MSLHRYLSKVFILDFELNSEITGSSLHSSLISLPYLVTVKAVLHKVDKTQLLTCITISEKWQQHRIHVNVKLYGIGHRGQAIKGRMIVCRKYEKELTPLRKQLIKKKWQLVCLFFASFLHVLLWSYKGFTDIKRLEVPRSCSPNSGCSFFLKMFENYYFLLLSILRNGRLGSV